MKSIQGQATAILENMIENGGKLEGEKGTAVSHALTRILPADGFLLMVVANNGGKVHGFACAAGELDTKDTMVETLKMVEEVAQKLGIETVSNVSTDKYSCPKCQARRQKQTVH